MKHSVRRAAALLLAACTVAATVGCQRTLPPDPEAQADNVQKLRTYLMSSSSAAGSGGAAAQPQGTGWATLRGKFLYQGDAPARQPISITKEPEICAPGGGAVLDEILLVDAQTGGIQNVVVFLRRASRVHDSATPNAEQVDFDQKDCLFTTHVQPMLVGQTLNLLNSDPTGHNASIDQYGFNQLIPANASLAYAPPSEAPFPVSVTCSIHPWMLAYVMPRDNGYFAVTGPDGSFEIANVPAGEELEFQVWHENATGPGGGLVLDTPEAKQLGWTSRGRFNMTLEENAQRELELSVPGTAFQRQ
jgi:hypothetical protein